MSRREDIVSCIDVTIMDRSAHSALPSPYSKIFPAFRAGAAVAHAAVLGGKRFIDFIKPHACVIAFVQQHGSECAPARIEHRLGLSSLCQSGGIHVADGDSTVGLDQAGAQFMQEIFSPIRDLGVDRSGALSLARTLRAGQGGFQVAVKALGLDRRYRLITERGKSPQPQIDSQTRDRAIEDRSDGRFIAFASHPLRAGHTDIQIPASAAVFTEIPRTQLEVAQTIAVPQRQPASGEVHLSPSIANRSDLKRNPAEGPAGTATLAPGQSDFPMLAAPPRVFFRDLLHRLNRQMQGAVTARDPFEERPEIESRQKATFSLEHFHRQFVAVVEDRVDLARQAREPRGMFVLHPQAQDPKSGRSRAGHPYSIPTSRQNRAISATRVYREWQEDRMAIYMRTGLQAQIWAAWGRGLSMATIARMLPTRRTSVYNVIGAQGGIEPPPRRRANRALSVLEREWIGKGLAAGCSLRMIARHLKRAPSTISREVRRNGGAIRYSGMRADEHAWRRARRP